MEIRKVNCKRNKRLHLPIFGNWKDEAKYFISTKVGTYEVLWNRNRLISVTPVQDKFIE